MLRPYSKVDFRNHVKDNQTGQIVQQGTYLNRKNLDHMDEAILELNEWAQDADIEIKLQNDRVNNMSAEEIGYRFPDEDTTESS